MATRPLRLGIIGAGNMTMKRHLPALARLRDEGLCDLVEICDLNIAAAQAAAKKYKITRTSHVASELTARTEIDAVCIFGPAEVHYRHGLETLHAGKHLFVEKPPAKNTAQLKEMSALAREKNLIAVAGFNRRFQSNIQEIKKRIREDAIVSAEATFHKPLAGVSVPFGMRTWLGVNGIHALDTLCYVMGGRPSALQSVSSGSQSGLPENFSAVIEWGNRHAIFAANNSAGARTERYVFHGYGASYSLEGKKLLISRDGSPLEESYVDTDSTEGIYAEFKSFFEAIVSGMQPVHTLENVISALYLVELIERGHRGRIDWSVVETHNSVSSVASKQAMVPQLRRAVEGRKSILILNPAVLKNELPVLDEKFKILYEEDLELLSPAERAEVVAIITGGPGASKPQVSYFDLLPSLMVLCVVGASVKRWGGEEAIARGIAVINTADTYADAVAEFIVMQALVGLRRASVSHDVMRRGGWEFSFRGFPLEWKNVAQKLRRMAFLRPLRPLYRALVGQKHSASAEARHKKATARMLSGRYVGIVGFGEITKKTVPLFQAFGAKVMVHSEYLDQETAQLFNIEKAPLEKVLLADVVSIQRGLSKRTERAFGTKEINALRAGTVFVNSGRAGLVDTDALIARLKKGDIFACLDVFDEEPLPARHILRTLPNVFLTSHLAASIHHTEGLLAMSSKQLVEKVTAYVDGKSIPIVQGRDHFINMT